MQLDLGCVCVCTCLRHKGKAGIFLGCDAQSTWRTGFVLALGCRGESQLSKHQNHRFCPSVSPVWNLSYTKYLELQKCHLGETNWHSERECPAPCMSCAYPTVSSFMEKLLYILTIDVRKIGVFGLITQLNVRSGSPLLFVSPLAQSGEIPNLNTQMCSLCQESSCPRGLCQGCDWESKAWFF